VPPEALRERVARALTPPELASEFSTASAATLRSIGRLHGQVARFDPTLGEALGRSRAKIVYQLSKIEKKVSREAFRRDERAGRETAWLGNLLYPRKHLQERLYGILPFLARHGPDLVGRLYEEIDLDCAGHRLLAV